MHFQYQIMKAILNLQPNAYGVTILETLEKKGTQCSYGAVYTTLSRMGKAGYISFRIGEPTPERGGRAKKFYRVTESGAAAMRKFENIIRH